MSRQRTQTSVSMKMTRDQLMREFFAPLKNCPDEPAPPWCYLSETRLFSLIIRYKPAGVMRRAALNAIYMYMNRIYEKEEGGIEIYLNDEDFEVVRMRKDLPKAEKNLCFRPRYEIRPTIEQIVEKMNQYWNMMLVEYNEGVPDGFEVHSDFFLPDGQFSELLKEKEEENAATVQLPAKRRSRRGTPDSSV